jgi:aldose 1-epimerase
VIRAPFGVMPDGAPVDLFTLGKASGMQLSIMSYGAAIVALRVPDRAGDPDDVVLGFDALEGYIRHSHYFGAIVGRYANRIARGLFELDGTRYRLPVNDEPHHLHGGTRGFDRAVWECEPVRDERGEGVAFRHTSPDGDQGYPGTLDVEVRYLLTGTNELEVDYRATADKPTPVNLTQHSYFNLAGAGKGDILDHQLTIDADAYTPVDCTLIPTGKIVPVESTPFDFRTPVAIGSRIGDPDPQLEYARGYDHNFVLRREGPGPAHAARVMEPVTGRTLDVFTTEPGLQLYAGNQLDHIAGKGGRSYGRHSGLCLETQHFPDSPNQPRFPSTILRPGARFESRTVLAFGIEG